MGVIPIGWCLSTLINLLFGRASGASEISGRQRGQRGMVYGRVVGFQRDNRNMWAHQPTTGTHQPTTGGSPTSSGDDQLHVFFIVRHM